MNLHPTAIVSPGASIAEDVQIGPNCFIDVSVKIGSGTVVSQGAYITGITTIGKDCRIYPYAIIGIAPQDLKYANEPTSVVIGDRNTIREFVTVHRGTPHGGGITRMGNDNLLMAYCHVAHDCQIGDRVALANAATLAGHITIEDRSVLGGLVGVHQFVQIGCYSMTGGCSAVDRDVLPYTQVAGNRAKHHGLNLTGLRRAGFPSATIGMLKEIYHLLFKADLKKETALKRIDEQYGEFPEARRVIEFAARSQRGLLSAE